jgi:hypothetical protein
MSSHVMSCTQVNNIVTPERRPDLTASRSHRTVHRPADQWALANMEFRQLEQPYAFWLT